MNGVAVAGAFEHLEEVLGRLGQLYALPPEFRQKRVIRRGVCDPEAAKLIAFGNV